MMWYIITIEGLLCDLTLLVLCSLHLRFTEECRLTCSQISWMLYYWIYLPTSNYIPHYIQRMIMCVINKAFIMLHISFLFVYIWIHISQIYQISTIRTKIQACHPKRYVTTCFQIRSQIIISMFFFYVCGLCFLLLYVTIFLLIQSWEGVGIHHKLVSDWIK